MPPVFRVVRQSGLPIFQGQILVTGPCAAFRHRGGGQEVKFRKIWGFRELPRRESPENFKNLQLVVAVGGGG